MNEWNDCLCSSTTPRPDAVWLSFLAVGRWLIAFPPSIRVRDVDPDIGTATGPAQATDEQTGIDDKDEQEVSGVPGPGVTKVDAIRQTRFVDKAIYEQEYTVHFLSNLWFTFLIFHSSGHRANR